jgi:branched-chain amino acid transport system ATP-binding protein
MQRHGLQYTFWRILSKVPLIGQETDQLLERVRLQARANTLAGELSYSEQRALEIAITLACDPLLILLDEPMAGMSHEETDYMVDLIRELTTDRTLIIVEHDMDVVFSLSDRISVLVYGQVLATGTPEQISNDAKVRKAYLGEKVGA